MIPDAPWIRDAEINGADDPPLVNCPVCNEECETIYEDWWGTVVGCDKCLIWKDAGDWAEEKRQAEIETEIERRQM